MKGKLLDLLPGRRRARETHKHEYDCGNQGQQACHDGEVQRQHILHGQKEQHRGHGVASDQGRECTAGGCPAPEKPQDEYHRDRWHQVGQRRLQVVKQTREICDHRRYHRGQQHEQHNETAPDPGCLPRRPASPGRPQEIHRQQRRGGIQRRIDT